MDDFRRRNHVNYPTGANAHVLHRSIRCQEAPDWWSLCKVRMRWETPATGSQRERESAVCVRVIQHTKGTADQTQVAEVKEIENTLLGFANAIVDQCFSEAP